MITCWKCQKELHIMPLKDDAGNVIGIIKPHQGLCHDCDTWYVRPIEEKE